MVHRFVCVCALAVSVVIAAGCASGVGGEPPEAPTVEYRLDTGDRMAVTVFGQPDLSTEDAAVDNAGMLQLPLIGGVDASGLTTAELQSAIEDKLADGYLTTPRVNIAVVNYRPFYILGEVESPGNYDYVNGLTVLNAVAMAGGYTYRASLRRVQIKRAGEPDYSAYSLTGTTPVLPGDTINIPDRFM